MAKKLSQAAFLLLLLFSLLFSAACAPSDSPAESSANPHEEETKNGEPAVDPSVSSKDEEAETPSPESFDTVELPIIRF